MEEIRFLSSKGYADVTANNGDCILLDTGSELVIYDCGCEEHAERVINYMEERGYSQAKLILSHNDADHFDGIPLLIDEGVISEVYTLLLLKYKDELWNKINNKHLKKETIVKRIMDIFDNIASLSKQVKLRDIFTDTQVCTGVTIVGPDKEYALNAVAKRIDGREGDTVDKETIVNAVSTQVKVDFGNSKLLLCGDSSFEAIEDKLSEYGHVQLPHHGKLEQANQIFEKKGSFGVTYYVSDNTGTSNGGSDDLPSKGYNIKNTKNGDQSCLALSANSILRPTGSYFRGG